MLLKIFLKKITKTVCWEICYEGKERWELVMKIKKWKGILRAGYGYKINS